MVEPSNAASLLLLYSICSGRFSSLGTVHYDRNQYGDAARAFARVVALQPKSGMARVMLGLSEFELGQEDAALRHIQQGKLLGTTNDQQFRNVMFFHEAVLLLHKGHFERAQDELDYLAENGVESLELTTALGMAVLRMPSANPPAGSAELVQSAGEAEELAARKKYDEARVQYKKLAEDYPKVSNVSYAYGRFLLAVHEDQAALPYFEREIRTLRSTCRRGSP